jgi:DHA1 family bicyclomycin/chloramphenicol resistance-like MFS transporter
MNASRDLVERSLSRLEFTLMLSMTMAVVALAIDMILPALGDIRSDFGLPPDSNEVAGVITFLFLGLGIGQMFWGPISDAVGRKRILAIGLALYAVSGLIAAVAPTLELLLVARFLTGFAGAAPIAIARSVVRDVYEGSEMAHAMSFIMSIFILVPVVAPTLGSGVLLFASWEWIFVFTSVFGGVLYLWSFRLPETLSPDRRIPFRVGRLARAVRMVGTNRMTMSYTVAQAVVFGFFASYLASSQLIIEDIFDLDAWFPVIFGGTALLMGAVMLSNTKLLQRVELRPLLKTAFTIYLAGGIAMAAAMIATDGKPSFGLYLITLIPLLASHALLVPNLNAIAMIPMGAVAGTAAAVIGTIGTLGGAVIGALIDRAYDGSLIPFGVGAAVTGLVAYAFMLIADRAFRSEYETAEPVVAAPDIAHWD